MQGGSHQQGTQVDSCPLQASGTGRYKENRNKITKMQEDLSSKEHKWTAALSKLKKQVDTKRTETRSQRCRRVSATRNTSGQASGTDYRY
jgi:hypothetical protein